jgi:hypothetical protein
MIKFFRKIRQNLLLESKTGKYLKYAVGEVILVVLGILIALQINNWNNNEINRIESLEFNKRLLIEISGNIDLANDKMDKINGVINSSREILELFNKKVNDENLKSLDSLIYVSISPVTIEYRTGTLNEGLNTGKVALIDSNILKSRLYGLLSNIGYVGKNDETYSTYLGEILQPFLYENFNYRKMDYAFTGFDIGTSKFNHQHNKKLLNNEQFENLIDNHFIQSNSQLGFHRSLKNELEEIKKLIEIELEIEK